MRNRVQIILSCSALLMSFNVIADDAMQIFERMGSAVKQLNYDGVFSYQTGNKLQSIRLIHRAEQEGEVEHLISLSGVAREVIRTEDKVTTIYPEGKTVQENHRPLGRGFPADLLRRLASASNHYQFSLGKKDERIASHYTQEIVVTPMDAYRYGYRLWAEKEHDLLLQSDLVDNKANVLETFYFSSIEVGGDIPDHVLNAQMQGNEMSWSRAGPDPVVTAEPKNDSVWQIVWLPDGFNLVSQQNRFKARNGASVEQQVYSDGLSSISIFIEKIRARHSHLHGGSKMGAVNAFGTIMNAHFITVVGKVPAGTVEKVGNSIQYKGTE